MAVNYYVPGVGYYSFDDGTTQEQAFKLAGVKPPEPDKSKSSSIYRGAGELAQGVGSAMKDVWPATGQDVEDWGKGVVEANPASYPNLSDIHGIGSALGYAKERVLEGVPLVAGGVAAGLAGGELAAGGLMAGAMGTQTYGDTREKQRVNGEDNIPAALGVGALAGTLGVAGGAGGAIRGAFGKAAEETVQRNLLQSAGHSALEQAAINPTISAASRAASGESVTDSDALGDYANQAVSGAIVGGAFGAAMHPFSGGGKKPIAETDNANLLSPDAAVNRDLNKDLFGNTPEDNLPIGPQAPEKAAAPTPDDLTSLKSERSRLLRAAADADNNADYYKYLDAVGKIDQQLNKPGAQDVALGQQRAAANADTGQQPSLFGAARPVERPAPPAPLALPSPDKFRPPLYVDPDGNVGNAPEMRQPIFQAAPEGSQGNLFSNNPDLPQTPAPVQGGGQPVTPLTGAGQPSLFGVKPTASVRSDFGPREILQRLRLAANYRANKGAVTDRAAKAQPEDTGFAVKTDPVTSSLANKLGQYIRANDVNGALKYLDNALETLQGSKKYDGPTALSHARVLDEARQIVTDYNSRRNDAYRQEADQQPPRQPPANVVNDTAEVQSNARLQEANQQRQTIEDMQAEQQAHQDKLAAVAKQHADAADQLAQANQTITDSHRNAIVQKALNDPNETNHAARVADTLKRNGLDPELRPHEQEAVDKAELLQRRRADATEAFSKPDTVEDQNPNQIIWGEGEPVPREKSQRPSGSGESNTTRGYHAPENFKLETQSEDAFQRLEDAKRRREAREASPALTPTRSNTRQGEMFTPTGRVKKAVDNRIDRDPNSPRNFKLTRPGPEDIHEPAETPRLNDLTSTPSNRQGEMFTPTGRIKKSADQTLKNSPANFKLETQHEGDFPAPRERAPEPAPAPDKRQGEMFTPTGKVKKSVDQGPFKTEVPPKAETRGDKIKREVAEKNAKTRQRTKEEPNAVEARTEPQGDLTEHSGAGEDRPTAEAGGGDRVEESRQGQAQTSEVAEAPPLKLYSEQTRKLYEMRQEKKAAESNAARAKPGPEAQPGGVTYDSVMRDAERQLGRDGESGLLKPKEYQQLSVLAEQKNVPPERLQEMLNKAIERNSTSALEEATGTRIKRQDASLQDEKGARPDFTWYEMGKAADQLQKRLNQLGLRDAGLAISHDLIQTKDGPANAAYSPTRKLIQVAMNAAKDMGKSLDHEVIHHLKNVGVITKPEFDQLVNALRRNKELSAKIDEAYAHLDQAGRDEELVAEGFARYANGDRSVFQANGIFGKIKAFFAAIKDAFAGRSAEDIFKAIDSGQIGARPRGGLERPAGVARESQVSPELTKARSAAIEKLPEPAQEKVREVFDTIGDWYRYGKAGMAFTQDLANMAGKMMPAAKEYIHDMGVKMQEHRAWDHYFEGAVSKFRDQPERLRGVGEGTVNDIIQKIDEAKAWPYEPEHLTKRADNPLASYPKADAELKAKFDALPAEAQKLVKDVFETNHKLLAATQDTVREVTGDAGLSEYKTLLGIDESEPYNSRRRSGDYVAFAKSAKLKKAELDGDTKKVEKLRQDEAHYWVSQHDTFAQAQKVVRELRKGGRYDDVLDARQTDKASDQLIGAKNMMMAFAQLKQHIADQVPDADPKVLAGISKLANDLYIRSLRQSSSRKGELRRLGVAGGDLDMMRNFVTQGRATAHFIASMKHSEKIFQTLGDMRQQAKAHPDPMAMQVANEMMLRHASSMTYTPNTLSSQMKSVAGNWMIVTNPGFFLQQVMQPVMLSAPYIGGRHGDARATGAMLKNMWDTGKLLLKDNKSGTLPIENIKDANVKRAMQELSERGIIDVGLNQELGDFTSLGGNKAMNAASDVLGFFKHATCKIEALNRIASGTTAYQLERAKQIAGGKSAEEAHSAATDYAYKVIYDTHGDYSGFNSQRFFRGPVASVAFQFKKFQIVQAGLLVKMMHDARYADDPVQRAAMGKALGYTIAHAALVGGAMGLPGAATAAWILNNVLTDQNEPFDIEQKVREGLGDPTLANILLKGVPTLGTHGIDVSEKLGMGGATSLFPYVEEKTSGRDTYTNLLAALPGPMLGSVGMNMASAYDKFHQWQYYRGLEQLMPAGLRNAMKAYREATEGMTNLKGDTLMKPEDVSFAQTVFTGLGLKTAEASLRQDKSGVETDKAAFYSDRTKRITLEFTQARKAGDTAGMQDARERFQALQQAKWNEGLPRSPLSTLINAAQQQRLRERATVEGVTYKQRSPGLRRAREEASEED